MKNYQSEQNKIKVITELFDDERKIIGLAPKQYQIPEINPNDLFISEDDELILLWDSYKNIKQNDFETFIKIGEHLYEKSLKFVCIYIACEPLAKIDIDTEIIETKAKIIIKIAEKNGPAAYNTLNHIKEKYEKGEVLNHDDLLALSMIPIIGPKNDRRFLRHECLEIWKKIN